MALSRQHPFDIITSLMHSKRILTTPVINTDRCDSEEIKGISLKRCPFELSAKCSMF